MELWDVYDRNRTPLHRTHQRGVPMPKGTYHIVVFVWIVNSRGQLLLTKRAPEKEVYPDFWAVTGGSALAGETSLQAIRRELFEETGIAAEDSELEFLATFERTTSFSDTYLLQKDVPVEALVMQEGETCGAMWVGRAEFEAMIRNGEIAPPDVERYRLLPQRFYDLFR